MSRDVRLQEVGEYLGAHKNFTLLRGKRIHWPRNSGPPKDLPTCGFDGSKCRQKGALATSHALSAPHVNHNFTVRHVLVAQSRFRCTAT